MNAASDLDLDESEFVEVDPTGRYGRYNEILGKGASKIVYRAFDEFDGIEVAWNQVKLNDFLQSSEDLERLYCEIHLLKTLKHHNIMKFYTSWVDTANRNINFVTELFTSGTLRQFRLKHKRVNKRAIKHWCRQILQGLLYLHSRDPPVIHRDLKCDNIFINGNQGEVKIGDLGLAAILRKSHAARCVGTPEFMAPEVYEEAYNELVDVYSFGMCILEMVTFEYPYSECTHPAQIYKKVVSGKKPDALYKVKDLEVRRFVEKCLATVSDRLSAWELLNDPFLQLDDYAYDLRSLNYQRDYDEIGSILRQPLLSTRPSTTSSLVNGYSNYFCYDQELDLDSHFIEYETNEMDVFTNQEDDHLDNVDIKIKGRKGDDGNIFLKLRIKDKEGHVRNIYFPFDIVTDTASSVAAEMVVELDIMDQDVNKIAEMIDCEIALLLPEWKIGGVREENLFKDGNCCQSCAPDGPMAGYLSSHRSSKNLQGLHCSKHGFGAVHGRFEEITYQVEGKDQCVTDVGSKFSSQSDNELGVDVFVQDDSHELHTHDVGETNVRINRENTSDAQRMSTEFPSQEIGNDISSEKLMWPEDKDLLPFSELRNVNVKDRARHSSISFHFEECINVPIGTPNEIGLKFFTSGKHSSLFSPINFKKNGKRQNDYDYESAFRLCSPAHLATAKSFYTGALLPHSLHRASSLPVDATDS